MKDITVDELVKLYGLQPHPEGGYFKETYRSAESIPSTMLPKHGGNRNLSTGIFFLLPEGSVSRLHRIKSDEMWHFYLGGPLTLVQISPTGKIERIVLGQDVKALQNVQHVVPAGDWFGAYPNEGSRFSFVGCTVAPGFDFEDFEMGKKDALLKKYPHAKDIIERLAE